jgi:hypothetical protein
VRRPAFALEASGAQAHRRQIGRSTRVASLPRSDVRGFFWSHRHEVGLRDRALPALSERYFRKYIPVKIVLREKFIQHKFLIVK